MKPSLAITLSIVALLAALYVHLLWQSCNLPQQLLQNAAQARVLWDGGLFLYPGF